MAARKVVQKIFFRWWSSALSSSLLTSVLCAAAGSRVSQMLDITKPLATERGAGDEFLKSVTRTAGNSAGNKGIAGRSAGSSALRTFAIQAMALLPALFLALSLFPAVLAALFRTSSPAPLLVPGSPCSIFQDVLSSTPLCGQQFRSLT